MLLELWRVGYSSIMVWFTNRDLPAAHEGRYFTYHKNSQIRTFVIVFIIIMAIETAGLHVLLHMWSSVLAWISVVLNIYGMLYLVALYQSARLLPHLLTKDKIEIRLGFQSRIQIDLDNIESIVKAKEAELGAKTPKDVHLAYFRMDTPQFEIRLKEPIRMKGRFGAVHSLSTIVIRVDDPAAFASEEPFCSLLRL